MSTMPGGLHALSDIMEKLYRRSLDHGIPPIDFEDGLILASLTFLLCAQRGYVRVVDLGAGIGFSTLFLAYGMSSGCRGELVAVEYRDHRFEELRANTATLSEIAGSTVRVTATHMEGLEYLSKLEDESLDILFVDVEKNLYPEVLRMSRRKLRGGGLAVFHNAIAPRPPDEFFEIARREFKHLIIPSRAGLLVAYRS